VKLCDFQMRNSLSTVWPKTIIRPTELQSSRNSTVTQKDVVNQFEGHDTDKLLISRHRIENNVYRIKKQYPFESCEDVSRGSREKVNRIWQCPTQDGKGDITSETDGDKEMVDKSGYAALGKEYRQVESLEVGRYNEFDRIWKSERRDHGRDRWPRHLVWVVELTYLSPCVEIGEQSCPLCRCGVWPNANLISCFTLQGLHFQCWLAMKVGAMHTNNKQPDWVCNPAVNAVSRIRLSQCMEYTKA